jgi:hypothetical protein
MSKAGNGESREEEMQKISKASFDEIAIMCTIMSLQLKKGKLRGLHNATQDEYRTICRRRIVR